MNTNIFPIRPIEAFTGKPRIQSSAEPSFMAQVKAGLIKPKTGVDHLLFGKIEKENKLAQELVSRDLFSGKALLKATLEVMPK